MDRQTIYSGQLPRTVDLLQAQQNAMVALAKLSATVLGSNTIVDGFTCAPTTPASLNVQLTAGSIYQLEDLEATTWSAISANTTTQILKQGILLSPVTLGITPPTTVGYSQVYLLEVQYQDNDTGSLTLPYYNAANPAASFSGPGNSGTAQNTVRQGAVAYQLKAGIAAATGSQLAPSADAGWTGLYTITVANGATTVTSGNISTLVATAAALPTAMAPFVPVTLPQVPVASQAGMWMYAADTSGTANAIVAKGFTPAISTLVPGMTVRVKVANAVTGATTMDVGTGANAVKRANLSALQSGDLNANMIAEFIWDGTQWQVANFEGFSASTTNNNTYTLTIPYCVDSSGSANSIVAPFSPSITSPVAGEIVIVRLANAITGATTITVNSLSAVAVVDQYGNPLTLGAGVTGTLMVLIFNGTVWQFANAPSKNTGGFAGLASVLRGTAAGSTKTASWTVAELSAQTALGGISYPGANLSLSFNGATTGAGGMDTGSTPISADLSIYAIYNPTTATWSTLGCAGSTSNGPVYSGANMPSGYVASGLIWAGKTDGSGNIIAFRQTNHRVDIVEILVAAVGVSTTWGTLSVSSIVPAVANHLRGTLECDYAANGEIFVAAYGSGSDVWVNSPASDGIGVSRAGYGNSAYETPFDIALVTLQTLYYCTNTVAGGSIFVTSYDF